MAGFQVFKVANNRTKCDNILDKVRKSRNVLLGTHVYSLDAKEKSVIVPNGIITINFDADSKIKDRKALLKSLHLINDQKGRRIERNKAIVRLTPKSPDPLKCCLALMNAENDKKEKIVATVMPDYDSPMIEHDFQFPKNDLYAYQWHLENLGAVKGEPKGKIIKGADMKVVDAWKLLGNKGSKKITIAVIDSSFDPNHPVYEGNVKFATAVFPPEDMAGRGRSGHGTACASLAAGIATGQGITGVAPNSPLILLQGSTTSWQGLEKCFQICIENGADIVSCSWGSIADHDRLQEGHNRVLSEMINAKGRSGLGCPVLYSVGNENQEIINHWAAHPDVIAVAGTTSADEHFKFSNRGMGISVCAPAGEWPIIAARANFESGSSDELFRDKKMRGPIGEYRHFNGTSASCPLVAGVCALMLSANPKLRATEVKSILEQTADKIGDSKSYDTATGYSLRFGFGRVNAFKAVKEALRRKVSTGTSLPEKKVTNGSGLFKFDVNKQTAKGWGVQVGVYAQYGNVLIHTNNMRKKFGRPTLVNISELNGETAYRLMIGPFSSQQEAKDFQKEAKAKNVKTLLKDLTQFK